MGDWTDVKAGDIYSVEMNTGAKNDWLILAPFQNYAAAIRLSRDEPTENSFPVHSISMKYADTGRVGYIFYDRLYDFVKQVTEDELAEIRHAIGESLGICQNNWHAVTQIQIDTDKIGEEAVEKFKKDLESRNFQIVLESDLYKPQVEFPSPNNYLAKIEELNEKLTKEKSAATIYKELYEGLLDRMLKNETA